MKLSIIIPVYNERKVFPKFWESLSCAPIDQCTGIGDVEILIVNDGSTDGTKEILSELSPKVFSFRCGTKAQVRVFDLDQNRGKGAATRTGIDLSTGDLVIIQDSDLEYSPADYPKLLRPFVEQGADAVFGSRFAGYPRRVLYFWHSLVNKLLTLLSNALLDVNLTDMESGYKVVRGDLLRELRLTSDRFGFEPEITARLAHAKAVIYEVPISYAGRTFLEGKKIRWYDGVAALFHVFNFGLLDRAPFKPGLRQTLRTLDGSTKSLYVPSLEKAFSSAPGKPEDRKILEIGAGIGSLTRFLTRHGEVTATDLSPEYIREIQRRLGSSGVATVKVWDATVPWEGSEKFDVIVAFNVLEHIENDVLALRRWGKMLNPGGRIILLVPNHPWLYSPADRIVGHYRRYSTKALSEKIPESGLKIHRLFYANALGMFGWAISGLVLRRASIGDRSLTLYRILNTFLYPLEQILSRFTGLSVVVVCEKLSPTETARTEVPFLRASGE